MSAFLQGSADVWQRFDSTKRGEHCCGAGDRPCGHRVELHEASAGHQGEEDPDDRHSAASLRGSSHRHP